MYAAPALNFAGWKIEIIIEGALLRDYINELEY